MQTCGQIGEFELIRRLNRFVRSGANSVVLGIGDDAAAVTWDPGQLLLSTVDAQVEGVHFEWRLTTPEKLGRKLAAINLSDLAAMGGTPRFALANLAVPPDLPVENVENFYAGLADALASFSVHIVGGNISAASQFLSDLTLFGGVSPSHLKTRAGARPGDLLCVTGTLGKGIAGLKLAGKDETLSQEEIWLVAAWQTPQPRVKAGQILGAHQGVRAVIDISDGLAGDLAHITQASQVGALVEEALLPVEPAARNLAEKWGESVLDWVLFGGEDYELLFTVSKKDFPEIQEQLASIVPVTAIGEITEPDAGIHLLHADGKAVPIPPGGWDHFRMDRTEKQK